MIKGNRTHTGKFTFTECYNNWHRCSVCQDDANPDRLIIITTDTRTGRNFRIEASMSESEVMWQALNQYSKNQLDWGMDKEVEKKFKELK